MSLVSSSPLPEPQSRGPHRRATLRDVAQLAGVSIKTVSNVVNDYPHVRDTTRERVREAILHLGYRPQMAAQQLRTGTSKIITLALPSLIFTYFSQLAQTFIDQAQERGRTVLLHSTSAGREEERNVLGGFQRVYGDGLIFNPLNLEETEFAAMARTPQPTVFIGEHLPEQLPAGCDYVKIDNVAASFDATTHLLENGRRHLAFIGAILTPQGLQPHSSGSMRRDGFLSALAAHGIDPASATVQEVEGWHRHHGADGLDALLQRMPEVDGIVCANDDLAIGVLARLRAAGRRVPEDVAVIGYDDTLDAMFSSPPLSTISPDITVLVSTALDLLTERIDGYDGDTRVVEAPYSLVVRESSASAPVPDTDSDSDSDSEELSR